MTQTRWGIIGPGTIAHNFADGLSEAPSGVLHAIASRSAERRAAFGARYDVAEARRYGDAEALVADPEVDAVYVATPHPFHAEFALMALRAGKAVLVEKPAGLNAAETTALVEAARQEGVAFGEGYMYRFHPQIARLAELVREGAIGELRHVRASFGFAAPRKAESRLYARELAGGGILDVGGYPVSAALFCAGLARGAPFAAPLALRGVGHVGPTGVDEVAYGLLDFGEGLTAEIACGVARAMANELVLEGSAGSLRLPNPWMPGRDAGPSDATLLLTRGGETEEIVLRHPEHLFAFEAEAASQTVARGLAEPPAPAVSHAESIAIAEALDTWRAEVGYRTVGEDAASLRRLPRTLPRGLPEMPQVRVEGLERPMSRFVMGCDNRNTVAEGAVIWDAWLEAGGNAFDTAFVYGAGRHEAVLGEWIAARGVADEITVIVKGAHSPYCTPDAIETQLDISLDRLNLERAPIYVMHRDNPDVPVGEFVDVLDRLHRAGRIGLWGGSNWSAARLAEARADAAARGKAAPSLLNNNLALAVMERPVWPGCVSSNDPETLGFLRREQVMHLSWSSGARGYFLPPEIRGRLPEDTAPETCFGSEANAERRRRAEQLAAERGTTAHAVAMAWVLAQGFPSFALIGPRSPGELASTLPALAVELSAQEVAWLNLEAEG
ncbi:hypothetical protein OG2516_15779 [Oceanicola granulosus HTCC2516]|uniref:Oxidoreductase n=1 Tax=Oceanicola granulosus (strain ATCC BAA-861 / DSM 15982 / KCTC 12143 / HTCC2516) TaxID=314256 RepID=Q2CBV8_OCEGH|nr:aldo/keto reductase [Oceanicola granulosus]EAR50162.1 hypothetical protein OG2516_15779 [Oceanicola granulosus HTCC2516]